MEYADITTRDQLSDIYIYQMDCVCQRYHKECSTHAYARMIAIIVEKVQTQVICTNDLSLDFFNNNIYVYTQMIAREIIGKPLCILASL